MINLTFRTPYSPAERFYTEAGEFTRPIYKAVLKKDGEIDLVEDGVELTYEKIQSYKDSVNINLIIARYLGGDVNAIPESSDGIYGDFVSVPKDLMEVLNSAINIRSNYEKSGFDGSLDDYLNDLYNRSVNVKNEEKEVIVDEQKPE